MSTTMSPRNDTSATVDPITFEVIRNRLSAITGSS